MKSIRKVVIVGPESTGKSTLSEQLAKEFDTLWVPEYAREYLIQHGMNYCYEDLLLIAKGQVALEEQRLQQLHEKISTGDVTNPLLIVDTNLYVVQVWCEFVFGKCHSWILDQIAERKYDQYLLCNPDLPWVKDDLREYPDLESRLKLYHLYRNIMIHQSVPWSDIKGEYDQRFPAAVEIVKKLL